jgi:hypothetical protein
MIYTNTASVFEKVISELTTAMGDSPEVRLDRHAPT